MSGSNKKLSGSGIKNSKNLPQGRDPFYTFKQITLREFNFLRTKYGFDQALTEEHVPECTVTFRGDKATVLIYWEWGGVPGVSVVKLGAGTSVGLKGIKGKKFTMTRIIDTLCPNSRVNRDFGFNECVGDKMREVIRRYASVLEEFGGRLLNGDFSALERRERKLKE